MPAGRRLALVNELEAIENRDNWVYPFHSAVAADSGLVGRSPWTARDAPVPLSDAEAGASTRARAPAGHDFAGDIWLSQGDTHFLAYAQASAPASCPTGVDDQSPSA